MGDPKEAASKRRTKETKGGSAKDTGATSSGRVSVEVLGVLVVVVFGAFIVAVAVVSALLILLPFREPFHVLYLLGPLVGGAFLWSMMPVPVPWEAPGPPFDGQSQPELAGLVADVAEAVGRPYPSRTYLVDEVEISTTYRGGLLGFGGRRVLVVGVPLMSALDRDELAAVLAHELAHESPGGDGDSPLGPVIQQVRTGIVDSVAVAGDRLISRPFVLWARLFLSATRPIAESQELAADRAAARLVSAPVLAGALARVPSLVAAFDLYEQTVFLPLLDEGYRPPFFDGFRSALLGGAPPLAVSRTGVEALGAATAADLDGHPALERRLRALRFEPARSLALAAAEPSSSMLRQITAIEDSFVYGRSRVPLHRLAPISWDLVAPEVLVRAWRRQIGDTVARRRPDLHPTQLPTDRASLAVFGRSVGDDLDDEATTAECERAGFRSAVALLRVSAVDAGYSIVSEPGAAVRLARDTELTVVEDYVHVLGAHTSAVQWHQSVQDAGLVESAADAASGTRSGRPAGAVVPVPAPSAVAEPEADAWSEWAGLVIDEPEPAPEAETDAGRRAGRRSAGRERSGRRGRAGAAERTTLPAATEAAAVGTAPPPDLRPAAPRPEVAPPHQPSPPAPTQPSTQPVSRPAPRVPPPALNPLVLPMGVQPGQTLMAGFAYESTPPMQSGLKKKKTLSINGRAAAWGADRVDADQVTGVAYQFVNGRYEFLAECADGNDLHFKLNVSGGNARAVEAAWDALVRWAGVMVEDRLVAELVQEVDERGSVTIGDVVVSAAGLDASGDHLVWRELDGAGLDGNRVKVDRRTGTTSTATVASIPAMTPRAVLLPGLIQALALRALRDSHA